MLDRGNAVVVPTLLHVTVFDALLMCGQALI